MRQVLMKMFVSVWFFGGLFMLVPVSAYGAPYVGSGYACLMEASSGQVIWSREMDTIRPVASTTKMMTAIVVMDYAGPDETAIVSERADRTPEYTIGLRSGQELTIAELLKAALLKSSNDAAVVLAEHVTGDERLFGHLMSQKSFVIGAMHTHFENASGLPGNDHYSTAYDLAVIGRYLLTKPHLRVLVGSRSEEFQHPGYQQPLTINNTNSLLGSFPGADGIKTGTTDAAGKCLVASATRDGRQLIAVALKSPDRNGDCARMLQYGFQDTVLIPILDRSIPCKTLKISGGAQPYLDIYPEKNVKVWKGEEGPDVARVVEVDYQLQTPVRKGQVVGVMKIYVAGKPLTRVDLVSREDIGKEPAWPIKLIRNIFALSTSKMYSIITN